MHVPKDLLELCILSRKYAQFPLYGQMMCTFLVRPDNINHSTYITPNVYVSYTFLKKVEGNKNI